MKPKEEINAAAIGYIADAEAKRRSIERIKVQDIKQQLDDNVQEAAFDGKKKESKQEVSMWKKKKKSNRQEMSVSAKKKKKASPFWRMLHYADKYDMLYMEVGCLGAIADGISTPIFMVIMSDLIHVFGKGVGHTSHSFMYEIRKVLSNYLPFNHTLISNQISQGSS